MVCRWSLMVKSERPEIRSDCRIFHVPTTSIHGYRNSLAQIQHGACESIQVKRSSLLVKYTRYWQFRSTPMSLFPKAKYLLLSAAWQALSHRVSYDIRKRALLIRHDIVAIAARRAMHKVEEIEEAAVEAAEGRYVVSLRTAGGVTADIPMIPEQLRLEKERMQMVIRLPEGVRVRHKSAVLSYLVRFMDKVFNISDARLGGVHDIDYDGKQHLTYTRRIEDFPLARAYRRYVGEGRVLPITLEAEHLALDLSAMFPKGFSIDLKKILAVKKRFSSGKNGSG